MTYFAAGTALDMRLGGNADLIISSHNNLVAIRQSPGRISDPIIEWREGYNTGAPGWNSWKVYTANNNTNSDLISEFRAYANDSATTTLMYIQFSTPFDLDVLPTFATSNLDQYNHQLMRYILRGDDEIEGSSYDDYLAGGTGNDTYGYSNGDTIIEYAGEGIDTIKVGITYTLGETANIENLTLLNININGTGNSYSNVIRGSFGNNILKGLGGTDTLIGGDGIDTLDGGTGKDKMEGGLGGDTFIVDDVGDVVTEASSAGTDTIQSSVTISTLAANVEHLTLIGTGAINGTGNSLTNYIYGNSGANTLHGGTGGNDLLNGYAGKDVLTGGSGNDIFRFNTALSATTNIDTITDFSTVSDTIQLENAIFQKLTASGALNAAYFKANTTGTATDSNDYIVYETDTGKLFYDGDGNGTTIAKIQFALIGATTHAALTAADFVVY